MPSLLDNDFSNDNQQTGTLSIDVNTNNDFNQHLLLENLKELAQTNSLPSHLTAELTNEDIALHTKTIISDLLTKITDTFASADNQNILTKCLTLLAAAKQCDLEALDGKLSKQLVTILIQNSYPINRDSICQLLIEQEYKITKQEITALQQLFFTSEATCVLKLLIVNESITHELIDHVITKLKSMPDNRDLYRDHLILIAQKISVNLAQYDNVIWQMQDYCKQLLDSTAIEKLDLTIIKEFVRLFKGSSFFNPITAEIENNLVILTQVLKIEHLSQVASEQSPAAITAKHELTSLLAQPETIITASTKLIISEKLKELAIPNKVWFPAEYYSKMQNLDLTLTQMFKNRLVSKSLNNIYQQYLLSVLNSLDLGQQNTYQQQWLISNINVCVNLLIQGHNLLPEVINLLFSNYQKYNLVASAHSISIITTQLLLQGQLPINCANKAIKWLKESLNREHTPFIASKILAPAFKQFALLNITDDGFTSQLCHKHLINSANNDIEIKELILTGLESIAKSLHKLPEDAITALTNFIHRSTAQNELRIRIVELLSEVPGSVSKITIARLATLLYGDTRIVEIAAVPIEPPCCVQQDIASEQLLEYLQLEKFVASHHFKIKSVINEDNGLIKSIVDQLSLLSQEINKLDLLALISSELNIHQSRYQQLIIENYSREEWLQNLVNGKSINDNTATVILAAAANSLQVNINIYYDNNHSCKQASVNPGNREINIASFAGRYFPLVPMDEYSNASNHEPNQIFRDYQVAKAVAKLFKKYALAKVAFPESSILCLEQALEVIDLATIAFETLNIIAKTTPNLLTGKLGKYIQEHDHQHTTAYDNAIRVLNDLSAQPSVDQGLIKQQLINLTTILNSCTQQCPLQLDATLPVITKILEANPALFNECLPLIKLISIIKPNAPVIEQILDSLESNYQELCYFIDHGCRSLKLCAYLEQYFNNNIELIKNDAATLSALLGSLKAIAFNSELKSLTLDNLIILAKLKPAQSVNISKILYLSKLNDDHFKQLEALYLQDNQQLSFKLFEIFARANKQLTTPVAIAALFKDLAKPMLLKILPSQSLQAEAATLLKLKTATLDSDKLALLSGLKQAVLQPETTKTILNLAKNKILTKEVIKIIANLATKPVLDQEISEIIWLLQTETPDEFQLLKPFLKINAKQLINTDNQHNLQSLLIKQFPDLIITSTLLSKITSKLSALKLSTQFIEQIILGSFLKKANTIDEFAQFLVYLEQDKLVETQIASYLTEDSLAKIIDILASNLLTASLQALKTQGLTGQFNDIIYLTYQLKVNGWQASNIAKVLGKINADNINDILPALWTVKNYHLLDNYRNRNGNTVVEVIDKVPSSQIEMAVFLVACNQFEQKLENKGRELIEKVIELNPQVSAKADTYLALLKEVDNKYLAHSQSPINNWSAQQITDWAIKFKTTNCNDDCKAAKLIISSWPKEQLAEVIAVLERANYLHTAKNGKEGHVLRDTQIISLLLLLDIEQDAGGKLLQIATGEGKSTITAMLAAILALCGFKVDVVTSSSVLAKSGKESAAGFFTLLNLTCGLNNSLPGKVAGVKPCYSTDIVYGDALNFQTDFLSNTSNQGCMRGDREFTVTIVDEVDSMLLDGSHTFAKQASPTPLMEYLLPIFTSAWHTFHAQLLPLSLTSELLHASTTKVIADLINSLPIPEHLKPYANFQAKHWAASLIGAATRWELDRDYVINVDKDGKKVINPVDNSTGVTQESMVWQNGLHQFLQIKHGCRTAAETLTSFFITNISYFLKYNKILGMTGTLGAAGSQEFLKAVYGVELAFIPTYKDKQLIKLPASVRITQEEHLKAIVESSYQEAVTHQRAVLIVCKTIKDVDNLILLLKERCGELARIINYSRSEDKLYNSEIEQVTNSRTIIVATNLAGRGTDIKTSSNVEAHGGLHVISTFLAKNARDEAQIQGRTARQGNCGSYQVIILDRSYDLKTLYLSSEEVINSKRQLREAREIESIRAAIAIDIPKFLAQDGLYREFTKLYLELTSHSGGLQIKNAKIRQLIEDFGIWLKLRDDSDNIAEFISRARVKFDNNDFTNPSYLVTQHYGVTEGYALLDSLGPALKVDDIYNFAAHYYAAKAYLSMGGSKKLEDYKIKATESLMEAANRLSQLISYLTSMGIVATKQGTTCDNQLLEQVTYKVEFFKQLFTRINDTIKVIQESQGKEVKVKSVVTVKELAPKLLKADIVEIDFLGVDVIFEVETYKPKKSWFGTVFTGCCAIVQMAVGALITIGSLGSASSLGISIFSEGLMDAYNLGKALFKGQAINIGEYLTGKAINYAIIGAQIGFSKMTSNAAAKSAVSTKVGEEIGKTVQDMSVAELRINAMKTLAKQSGLQLVNMIAVEEVTKWISSEVRDNFLDGLENKIAQNCFDIVCLALERNQILLEANCNIEREQIIKEVENLTIKLIKTPKYTRVINELASGVFKTASANGYGLGATLLTAHKIASTIDVAGKIQSILNNVKTEIEIIINNSALRAKQRLNVNGSVNSINVQRSIKEALASKIGTIISSSLMNLVQHKITTPLVRSSVDYVVDKSLGDYHKHQQQVLETYIKEINKQKTTQSQVLADAVQKTAVISMSSASNNNQEATLPKELPSQPDSNKFMITLAHKLNQPIYLFKDGILDSSYGITAVGRSISIAYDSQSGQYFNLSTKDNSSSCSLYQVIAKAQNVYNVSELIKINQELTLTHNVVHNNQGKGIVKEKEFTPAEFSHATQEAIDYTLLLQAKIKHQDTKTKQAISPATSELLTSIFNDSLGQTFNDSLRQTETSRISHDWLSDDLALLLNPASSVLNAYQPTKQQQYKVAPSSFDSKSNPNTVKIYDVNAAKATATIAVSDKEIEQLIKVPTPLSAIIHPDNVSKSAAQSSTLFSTVLGVFDIPTAYGTPDHVVTTTTGSNVVAGTMTSLAMGYGARRGLALANTALAGVSTPVALIGAGLATGLSLEYNSGQSYTSDVQRYIELASNSNIDVKVTAADYLLANSRGVFDLDNPQDMKSLEHIARGIAIERSNIDSSEDKSTILSTLPHQPSKILKTDESAAAAANDKCSDDFGICKQSKPYCADDHKQEGWMFDANLKEKHKVLLHGVELYGLNPVKVEYGLNPVTVESEHTQGTEVLKRVNTELPGGNPAARECFKNLTGVYPEECMGKFTKSDGTIIQYRPKGDSGHPKVEINRKTTNKLYEKITFK